jgi:hypothetical protein
MLSPSFAGLIQTLHRLVQNFLKHVGHSQAVNLDPDTGEKDSEVMKTVVRLNEKRFQRKYLTAPATGSAAHSLRRATSGSTFVARLAGM